MRAPAPSHNHAAFNLNDDDDRACWGGGRFRWPRYSEGLAVVCLKTVGIKMEESAKEGSDGSKMDGWMDR